jgi:hypothetical protein
MNSNYRKGASKMKDTAALEQALLMYLRDNAFNDAVGPVRKKVAGEWLLQRDFTLIDKLTTKHLPGLMALFQKHTALIENAARLDEQTITTLSVLSSNILVELKERLLTQDERISELQAERGRLEA